jgi:hypothetical protein
MPMTVSNFAGESLIQSFGMNNVINEKIFFRVGDINSEGEKLCEENLVSFFYGEIFRTIELALNAMKERIDVTEEQIDQCKNELNQIFGENLVKLFFNSNI